MTKKRLQSYDDDLQLNGSGVKVTIGSSAGNDFTVNTTALVVEGDTGKVGVGITPTYNFHLGSTGLFVKELGISKDIVYTDTNTIQIGNNGTASYLPSIVGSTSQSLSGLVLGAATTDGNTSGDMVFNVRENDNSDFSTLTSKAFVFQRYGTELATILRNGNVGIGTASPTKTLHAKGSGSIALLETTTARGSGNNFLLFSDPTGNKGYFGWGSGASDVLIINNAMTDGIRFDSGATTNAMFIDSSGNVGIGTASPDSLLSLGADSSGSLIRWQHPSTTMDAAISVFQDAQGTNMYIGTNYYYDGTNIERFSDGAASAAINLSRTGSIDFRTATGSEDAQNRMTIATSGNVGIGQAPTSARLVVTEDSDNQNSAVFYNSGSSTPYGIKIEFTAAHPNNNTQYFLACVDDTENKCLIYSDGDLQNRDNSYGGISDERLKQDIIDASSQIEDIKAIKVRKYRFKSDVLVDENCHNHIGVIAQELQQTSPGLVNYNKDTDEYSVQYSILYMKAVKALQEVIIRSEEQQAMIEELKAKVEALETGV